MRKIFEGCVFVFFLRGIFTILGVYSTGDLVIFEYLKCILIYRSEVGMKKFFDPVLYAVGPGWVNEISLPISIVIIKRKNQSWMFFQHVPSEISVRFIVSYFFY